VQSGDTLGGIASTYGTTVEELLALNGLSDADYLYVGQELQIPGGGVAQTEVVASTQPTSDTTGGGGSGQVHVVQSGDTLYGIAEQYGTDVEAIIAANGLTDADFLSLGQELQIP
jgi:lysozyme